MSLQKPSDKADKIPKLRTSCDACLQAKTRCEKTGTACRRCLNQGISCQFSPSQRCGKPPKKSSTSNDSKISRSRPSSTSHLKSPRASPAPTSIFSPSLAGTQSDGASAPDGYFNMSPLNQNTDTLAAPDSMQISSDHETDIKISQSSENLSYRSSSIASTANLPFGTIDDFWGFTDPEVPSATLSSTFTDLAQTTTTPALPSTALDFAYDSQSMATDRCCEHDCTNQALSTLLGLYSNQYGSTTMHYSSSSSASSSPKSTLEAQNDYLQHCSSAIATIEQLLRCPKAVQGDIALVCAAIIYKTVSHLKAARQPYTPSTASGTCTPMIPMNDVSDPLFWQFEAMKRDEQTQAMMQQVSILQKMSSLAQLSEALVARRVAAGAEEGAQEILLIITKSLRSQLRSGMKDMAEMSSSIAESYQI